jgi:twitching motility protein PilT
VITFFDIVQHAWENKVTDLHVKHGTGIFKRKGGRIFRDVDLDVTPEQLGDLILSTLTPIQRELLERNRKVDYALQPNDTVRVRGNAYYQKKTLAGAYRLIPMKVPTLNDLGIPAIAKDFALRPRGLVIVAGPSGAGKTTTAAAMVGEINRATRRHIITIEDPIEYVFKEDKSVITQRELGTSTLSFHQGLKGALREDPDVVFIGEMRDLQTFSTGITMAETGHLVIATVQSIGAAETIDRIVNMFPPVQQEQMRTQLSLNLQGVISQFLLPAGESAHQMVPACEVLNPTFALRALIRKGEIIKMKGAMETSVKDGCMPMRMAIESLHKQNKITDATMKTALTSFH